MNKRLQKGLSVAIGAAAIAAFNFAASAQDKKMMPAEKWAACSSLKREAACKAGRNCDWVVERKEENGKVKRKAYCRSNTGATEDGATKE